MNETEKENVKEAEEEEEEGIWVREQRKRKRKRSRRRRRRRRRREEQLADRLDLAPASDGGQRQWAEVKGQTSVIFLLFFSAAGCRSHIEAVSEKQKKKKKKKDTHRTSESGKLYPFRCPTPT